MALILLTALSAFLGTFSHGQGSGGDGLPARLHYQGNLAWEQWSFPRKGGPGQPAYATWLIGEADFVLSFAPGLPLEARLHPALRWQPSLRDRGAPRMEDLYLDYFARWFEIRAGYQVFSWKTVESISQTDILNQTDRSDDFLDPPKLGEPSVRLRLVSPWRGDQVLEFYYLRYFTPAALPSAGGRYDILQGTPFRLSDHPDALVYQDPRGRWAPQWAVRLQARLLGIFDVNTHFFQGYRRFPVFVPAGAGRDSLLMQLYPIQQHAGMSFQGVLGNWLLKGEGAWQRFPKGLLSPSGLKVRPYAAYTLGLEYTFYSALVRNHDLGVIAEFIGDTDWERPMEELEGFRPYRSHVFAGLRYAFNNTGDRALLMGMLAGYRQGDRSYRFEYEERISRTLGLQAEVTGLRAGANTPLRPLEQAFRISAGLKFHF